MGSCAAWSRSRYSLSLLSIPLWVAVAISLALDLLSATGSSASPQSDLAFLAASSVYHFLGMVFQWVRLGGVIALAALWFRSAVVYVHGIAACRCG